MLLTFLMSAGQFFCTLFLRLSLPGVPPAPRRPHPPVCAFHAYSVMSGSLQPHGLWPTRLLRPWDFSREEYWSGLPFPPSGDLPDVGIETAFSASLALARRFFNTEPPRIGASQVNLLVIRSCRRLRFSPRLGSSPREEYGYSHLNFCLENHMDRGVWWATVQGVPKSHTPLSD